MKNLKTMIEEIEKHTGKKFDFSNKRQQFYLKSKIDRMIEEHNRVVNGINNVLAGQLTYDQTQYKTILDSNRKKD